MDFKKFGRVVLILGIPVLLYGGFQWFSHPDQSPDGYVRNNPPRDDAIKIVVAGGIVAFVGLGISYSANKKE